MKLENIKSEEDIARYVEGCMNDWEAGLSGKVETMNHIMRLIVFTVSRGHKWRRIDKMPTNVPVIIKTKTGIVRVAKRVVYPDTTFQIHYGSVYFKDVIGWQPLPV